MKSYLRDWLYYLKLNSTKKYLKGLVNGIVLTLLIGYVYILFLPGDKETIKAILNPVNIVVNGQELEVDNILYKNNVYASVEAISKMLDKEVSWSGSRNTLTINDAININSNIMERLIVLPHDTYDEYAAERMMGRIFNIDSILLEGLIDKKVKIKLTNTNVTDVEEYKYLKGSTPRGYENTGMTWDDIVGLGGNPVVARIGYSEPSYANKHSSVNLELHEVGHAIDRYIFSNISNKKEFRSIIEVEIDDLFPYDRYLSYPEEYFAESFAMFHLNYKTNRELMTKAPLTYDFIRELANKFNE